MIPLCICYIHMKNTYRKITKRQLSRIIVANAGLELVKDNLIIFNSSSEYLIINYYIILDAEETNLIDFQLIPSFLI